MDQRSSKTADYASFGNTGLLRTVVDHLPAGGAVLDVGCASGGLLGSLDGRAGRREGIEPDPAAAAAAAAVADRVHVGGLGDALDVEAGAFDVVVLGDVLEHVADPAASLRAVLPWLRDGGVVVISLPNVAHWSVRWRLARGRWDYEPSGILDDTHLRFFTYESGHALVQAAGLRVVARTPVLPGLHHFAGRALPRLVEGAWHRIGRRAPNLFAYQQILVARP